MFFFDWFFSAVGVLMSVAFLTLVERKVMGYIQFRKGPSKVLINGLFQPFSDVIKLFIKRWMYLKFFKIIFFSLAPTVGCFFIVFLWIFFPRLVGLSGWRLGVLFFFAVMSLISYFLFFCGFSSVSVYSIIGFIRSVSQVISYEVCIVIFILFLVYRFVSLSFYFIRLWRVGLSYFYFLPIYIFVWFLVSFSESNRSPFDFSEGESELVSGFNVEYFGGLFSVIFVVEYGMIIFIRYLRSWLFFWFFKVVYFIICFFFSLFVSSK